MAAAREAADRHRACMLDAVAAEIAESLALGGPLQEGVPSQWLGAEMLAHSEDESEAVAAECVRLRVDLAAALRAALARWPQAAGLLRAGETPLAPAVRAEVRGTAGRSIVCDAFTVGSAPECDVQAVGDSTVRPLDCVVVSLPGGVVVADLWSGAAAKKAIVFQHGERITLHIGDRTAVGLGPDARRARKQLPAAAQASGCKADALSKRSTAFISPSRVSSTCSSRSRSPRRRGAGEALCAGPPPVEAQ
mmetsp:Transcript_108302/g.306980  ORF Transcript_108302/g.306980 Transcript_108302/m.306980 type:complete len:250 (-) Transcript_108302:6-755(-)